MSRERAHQVSSDVMRKDQWYVEVRILSPGDRAATIRSRFQTLFVPDGTDLVFRSALDPRCTVSRHLTWFHGMLGHERRFIRQLEAAGVHMIVRISSPAQSLSIEPDALLLAHQLHLRTEIVACTPGPPLPRS